MRGGPKAGEEKHVGGKGAAVGAVTEGEAWGLVAVTVSVCCCVPGVRIQAGRYRPNAGGGWGVEGVKMDVLTNGVFPSSAIGGNLAAQERTVYWASFKGLKVSTLHIGVNVEVCMHMTLLS